jgi:hypothetical protein
MADTHENSPDTDWWMYAEHERMSQEEAEAACRSFEFPGYQCLGTVDLTAEYHTWALKIALVGRPDAYAIFVAAQWWQFWTLFLPTQRTEGNHD